MHRWTWRLATAACVILSQPNLELAQGESCMDWLFGREPERPAVVYYSTSAVNACGPCCPPTVTYSVPSTTCGAPVPSCGQSPMSYQVPQVVAPTPARINPIPQTYYRTTYKQIPVTLYRPISGRDVVTGYPVTIMRPCTTTEWQVRRQPTGIFGRGSLPAMHGAMPATTMASPGCGCNGSTSMPAAPPYYSPPAAGMLPPSTPPMTPGTAFPPPALPPTTPPTTPPGSTLEPAEQRPALKPETPATSAFPTEIEAPQLSGPAQHEQATERTSSLPSSTAPMTPIPPRGGNLRLRPVPDPDARPQAPSNSDEAPQLLNPRDRMASAAPAKDWAYSAINWPTQQTSTVRPTTTPVIRSKGGNWDASGWRSVSNK